MVVSPPYACQVVVVAKLIAVFIARSGERGPGRYAGSNVWSSGCTRSTAYSSSVAPSPKTRKHPAYRFQSISAVWSTPASRYVTRSRGRIIGSSQVRSPLKTRAR